MPGLRTAMHDERTSWPVAAPSLTHGWRRTFRGSYRRQLGGVTAVVGANLHGPGFVVSFHVEPQETLEDALARGVEALEALRR